MKEYTIRFNKDGIPIKPVKIGATGIPDWFFGILVILGVIVVIGGSILFK